MLHKARVAALKYVLRLSYELFLSLLYQLGSNTVVLNVGNSIFKGVVGI